MKLSQWAKQNGIAYQTAYTWFRSGILPVSSKQLPTGTILVYPELNEKTTKNTNVYIYTRVSTYERKDCLIGQISKCEEFAISSGLQIDHVIKEIASGMNDNRPKLIKMLENKPSHIIVENKDRLTRFGFNYLEVLLQQQGCEILVVNRDHEDEHDLMTDMISIITSYCCRLYGMRRGLHKAKQISSEIDKNE